MLSEVRQYGIFNARGCFNCGSCTLSCNLSTGSIAFPRRTMQSVLLGLRNLVSQTLDPWLCHDCGDCSTNCPRQAQPRESMATLRRYLMAQYDWTGLASRIHRSTAWELGSLGFAALLVPALALFYHLYLKQLSWGDLTTAMGLEHMFNLIIYFTWAVFLIPAVFVLSFAFRMFQLTTRRDANAALPLRFYLQEVKTLLLHLAAQLNIRKCRAAIYKIRWRKHWLLAFGCVLMFVTKFFFLRWFQTDAVYPLYNPQRWLGYLAAAFIIFGSLDILVGRLRKREPMHRTSVPSDWTLPVLLLLTAASGLAVHILRYTGLALASHYTYAVHLMIAVPMLVVEVPFGKSSHMIYRPLALYLAAVKERAQARKAAEVPTA